MMHGTWQKSSEQLITLINTLYKDDAFLDDHGNRMALPNAIVIAQLNAYIKDETLLLQAYEQMPYEMLLVAMWLHQDRVDQEVSELLNAILNNETILQRIDLHQSKPGLSSVFEISVLFFTSALALLFLKLPYAKMLPTEMDDDHKLNTVLGISLHDDRVMPKLLKEKAFTTMLDTHIATSAHNFITLMNHAALKCCNEELLEYVLCSENNVRYSLQIIKDQIDISALVCTAMINFAIKKAYLGMTHLLQEILSQAPIEIIRKSGVSDANLVTLLLLAQKEQEHSNLKKLISAFLTHREANLNVLSNNLTKMQLCLAIAYGKLTEIERLIENKIDLNLVPAVYMALTACFNNPSTARFKIIEKLIQNGADVEQTYAGLTPIFWAIWYDFNNPHLNLSTLLLETNINNKANVNVKCTYEPEQEINLVAQIKLKESKLSAFANNDTPLKFCLNYYEFYVLRHPKHKQNVSVNEVIHIVQILLFHSADLTIKCGNEYSVKEYYFDEEFTFAKLNLQKAAQSPVPYIGVETHLVNLKFIHDYVLKPAVDGLKKDESTFIVAIPALLEKLPNLEDVIPEIMFHAVLPMYMTKFSFINRTKDAIEYFKHKRYRIKEDSDMDVEAQKVIHRIGK